MFLIETKDGRELDRWSTLELALANARELLQRDRSLGSLTIIEGNQQTGKRVKIQTVRRSK